jgi:arabinogalactan endo-1,4-beta-galactosidase
MSEINPDIIQIGNETNDGMLCEGKLSTNESKYIQLVQEAITAVRNASNSTKIMLHYAGITNAEWYFQKVSSLDYDYIGLSYYPVWHRKSLTTLNDKMVSLSTTYNKSTYAETAYPFTLQWNDWTTTLLV